MLFYSNLEQLTLLKQRECSMLSGFCVKGEFSQHTPVRGFNLISQKTYGKL